MEANREQWGVGRREGWEKAVPAGRVERARLRRVLEGRVQHPSSLFFRQTSRH